MMANFDRGLTHAHTHTHVKLINNNNLLSAILKVASN